MLRTCAAAGLAAAAVNRRAAAADRFEPTWTSIDSRPTPPWFSDAKFGIFIHWGLYSVPAFGAVEVKGETSYAEWYWNSLTKGMKATGPTGNGAVTWNFHRQMYGPNFPYSDFAPMFRAELYDPDYWADLFVRAGAKYVALTSKHHEGYTLWRSAEANRSWGRPWNAVDVGPKRDLLFDLMEAGRRRSLDMGIYYSLYEWYNPLWLTDKKRYVTEHMMPQFKDVVTHAKPSIIFSDGEWDLPSEDWHSTELLSWLFNESPVKDRVVINDRWGKETRHKHGGYFTTEYTSGMEQTAHPWEESRGMGFSYGYNRAEKIGDYHSGRELLLMLIDIVSRGGNLLLDIGPAGDGTIPVIMQERLLEIGNWLRPNGEAIYGTRAWKQPRQWSQGTVPKFEQKEFMADYNITKMVDTPPAGLARVDAFFTTKGDTLYAILPRRPRGAVTLNDVAAPAGARVTLLATNQPLESARQGNGITVRFPDAVSAALPESPAYVVKIAGIR
jgi:alpha-L-fucosidase